MTFFTMTLSRLIFISVYVTIIYVVLYYCILSDHTRLPQLTSHIIYICKITIIIYVYAYVSILRVYIIYVMYCARACMLNNCTCLTRVHELSCSRFLQKTKCYNIM